MMHADIKDISPIDDLDWWEGRRAGESPDPLDAYGWFTLEIGDDEHPDGDLFYVLVSTPAAVARAQGDRKFRGIIVQLYERTAIEEALREHVSAITGKSWRDVLNQLRPRMKWEYEGM